MWITIALFLHILGVLLLVTALGIEVIAYFLRRRAQHVQQIVAIGNFGSYNGVLHPVGLLLILGNGIFMAVSLGVLSQAWVILAFSATLLLPVLGMTIDAPRSSAIHRLATKLAAERDAPGIPAELRRRIYDPVLGTWNVTGTVLTLWMLFLMTLKPGWLVGLSGLAVTLVLGLALSLRFWLTAAPPVDAA